MGDATGRTCASVDLVANIYSQYGASDTEYLGTFEAGCIS